eukprot:CAMPEP_0196154786 /NCGR_PEP_ID=MMETSP0910-20130528/39522_1 /TAXON_ID=49265 /ORGANISM="Thalassiosira rotula, Strain GSO102" /LENGTH=65 /DNA_ID=CAMNT_0041418871 /DNA_START=100 /DNA_END=298 /DNA_ORIENTATION=-
MGFLAGEGHLEESHSGGFTRLDKTDGISAQPSWDWELDPKTPESEGASKITIDKFMKVAIMVARM